MSVAGAANRINREQRAKEIAQLLLETAHEIELSLKHSLALPLSSVLRSRTAMKLPCGRDREQL